MWFNILVARSDNNVEYDGDDGKGKRDNSLKYFHFAATATAFGLIATQTFLVMAVR